jgi:hypothetical protein
VGGRRKSEGRRGRTAGQKRQTERTGMEGVIGEKLRVQVSETGENVRR